MARTSCMLMRWRWCPLCTRATCLVWILFYSTNSLKQQWAEKCRPTQSHYPNSKFLLLLLKGILSTSCVFFSYPKLLSISVLTFIKWRLTPSYAAKDTIFWQKRPKTIVIRIIVWMTIFKSIHMWTRLEHAHCLETINNMWFLGKRETVNAWKKADFDGFREKDE
jgi:hypothetical protein